MSDQTVSPESSGDIVREAPVKQAVASAVVEMPARSAGAPAGQRGPGGAPAGGRGGRGGRGGPRGGARPGRPGQRGDRMDEVAEESKFIEKVVHINRCAKVVKGGRRFSFAALVVVCDGAGKVGVVYGKAKEVPDCIRKGTEQARKNMVSMQLRGDTIPHPVTGSHDGGTVMLRPASEGTGVIAGGGVRAVLEACGIKNVLSKSLQSNNPSAVVFATMDALSQLRTAQTINALRRA